jgi:cyclophilin family peptidyl-prolyl cis-trans isomerase
MGDRNVVLETSMGNIVVELYWDHAPKTCANFAGLAERGYYDGTIFHRVVKVKSPQFASFKFFFGREEIFVDSFFSFLLFFLVQ